MAGGDKVVVVMGYVWYDVTDETTADRVYDIRDVIEAGGDERRINTVSSN